MRHYPADNETTTSKKSHVASSRRVFHSSGRNDFKIKSSDPAGRTKYFTFGSMDHVRNECLKAGINIDDCFIKSGYPSHLQFNTVIDYGFNTIIDGEPKEYIFKHVFRGAIQKTDVLRILRGLNDFNDTFNPHQLGIIGVGNLKLDHSVDHHLHSIRNISVGMDSPTGSMTTIEMVKRFEQMYQGKKSWQRMSDPSTLNYHLSLNALTPDIPTSDINSDEQYKQQLTMKM